MGKITIIDACIGKRVKVKVKSAEYLNLTKMLTPNMLRDAADKLENDSISKIEFKHNSWGSPTYECYVFRPETAEETIKREEKEEKARIKKEESLRKEKDLLIKKAEALGMKVIE